MSGSIRIETDIPIRRPIEEVFDYIANPGNFPHWNSAVEVVRKTTTVGVNDVGSRYRLERQLPTGRAENELEVVARERPTAFAIKTTSGPTPFGYRFKLTPEGDATIIHVDADTDLGVPASLLAVLVRRAVQRGVEANLAALKTTLEALPAGVPAPA
jgi:uncharacterized protein YndB with AHSA1/START domain